MAAHVDVVVFDEHELVGELRIAHQSARSAAAPACPARRADAPCPRKRTAPGAWDRSPSRPAVRCPPGSDWPACKWRSAARIRSSAHPGCSTAQTAAASPRIRARRSACSTARRRTKLQQPRLQAEVRFPELAIVDVFDAFPDARLAAVLMPVRCPDAGRTGGTSAAPATTARARRS